MSKKILIINTGGTLSSVKGTNGLIPGMSSNDMLEELRMVSKNLELETEDFCSLDSANIGPTDWAGLAKLISQKSYDYHGIVVIHGTDTMAYTSSMLSFMLQNISIPVVITGSQLSIANPVADALENCRCNCHLLNNPGLHPFHPSYRFQTHQNCRWNPYRCFPHCPASALHNCRPGHTR